MFEEVLPKKTKDSLALLGKSGLMKDAYLAGGTALALQIGHRISVDFDFFTQKQFESEIFVQQLSALPINFRLERLAWGTILGHLGETRFSLFYYNYPLLVKQADFLNINMAGIKDIAAMKIAAISDRGTRRDFIDLYFILEKEKICSLEEALELYDAKFKVLNQNKMHILKSLIYFEAAEKVETPKMLKNVNWKEVKKYFEREVKLIAPK